MSMMSSTGNRDSHASSKQSTPPSRLLYLCRLGAVVVACSLPCHAGADRATYGDKQLQLQSCCVPDHSISCRFTQAGDRRAMPAATDRTRGPGEGLPAAESPQSCHHRRGRSAAAPAIRQMCCRQSHCRTVRVSMRLRHRTVDEEQLPTLSLRQIRAPFSWASVDITAENRLPLISTQWGCYAVAAA